MHNLLIDVPTLREHLNEGWLILDARHDLADAHAGHRAYQQQHIPGAVFISGDEVVSGPKTGSNGRHPLPDPAVFAVAMREAGLTPERQVVVYDGGNGMFASRVWWMLRWIGHPSVAILDGGWAQWLASGAAVECGSGASVPVKGSHTTPAASFHGMFGMPSVDVNFVEQQLGAPEWLMLDARSAERYRGEVEPIDPIAGHIPGALNRPNTLNVQDGSGCFKSPQQLAAEFHSVLNGHDPSKVIHQCGSGISACHNLFAMELAGLTGSALYAGSWSEWCADSTRPMARSMQNKQN